MDIWSVGLQDSKHASLLFNVAYFLRSRIPELGMQGESGERVHQRDLQAGALKAGEKRAE